jgi:hypothetical protein
VDKELEPLFDICEDWHDHRFRQAEVQVTSDPPRCPGTCGYLLPRSPDEPVTYAWSISRWDPKTTRISDFTWARGGNEPLVTRDVRSVLIRECSGFTFHSVFVSEPKKRRSKQIESSRTPCPDELFRLIPNAKGEFDLTLMPGTKVKECVGCHRRWYDITSCPQVVVRDESVRDMDVFQIKDFTGVMFCKERFRKVVMDARWSNILFKHRGVVVR